MLNRPGIEVSFTSSSGAVRSAAAPNTYFTAGYAEWGPINTAVFLADKRQLSVTFGGALTTGFLVSDLQHFFDTASGSGRAYAVRGFEIGANKTGSDYTAATTLNAAATPVLKVSAVWPGAIGNTFRVDVVNDTTGQKKVVLRGRGGVPVTIVWNGKEDDVRAQIDAINAKSDASLCDFRVTIQGTFSVAGPDVTDTTGRALFEASANAVALTGGSDGETQNFPLSVLVGGVDSVTGLSSGFSVFEDKAFGPGVIGIPGYTPTNQATSALELHAKQYRRLALVSLIPSGAMLMRAQDAVTLKNTLTQSDYIAYFYPRVYATDGTLSPLEGYVAGLASRNQARSDEEGGIKASVTGGLPISGVEQIGDRDPVREAEAELLYANGINYVCAQRGTGYRLDCQLLASPNGAISRMHHRNILNKMGYDVESILESFRDRNIDSGGRLQSDIATALRAYLDPFQPGKFPPNGNTFFNSAVVVTDNTVQNAADLSAGLLHVEVSGSLTPKAERISLNFNVTPISIN